MTSDMRPTLQRMWDEAAAYQPRPGQDRLNALVAARKAEIEAQIAALVPAK